MTNYPNPITYLGNTPVFSIQGLYEYAKYYYNAYQSLITSIESMVEARVSRLRQELNKALNTRYNTDNFWKKKYLKLKYRVHMGYDVFESSNGIKVLIPKTERVHTSPVKSLEALKAVMTKVETALTLKNWVVTSTETEYGENGKKIPNPYKEFTKDRYYRNRQIFKDRK